MEPTTLGLLAGLALIDSTSIGTLVLPMVLLLAPRVDVRRFALYLATVAGFYLAVGLVLVLTAGAVAGPVGDVLDLRAVRWAELGLGVLLLAYGLVGDVVADRWRRWRGGPEKPSRAAQWRARLVGPDADDRVVIGTGLAAGTVELAGMLPFLAAVGLITRADPGAAVTTAVVTGYVVLMVVPAVVLLGLRLALASRVEGRLERFSAWLDKQARSSGYWIAAIVGLLLIGDARSVL